MDSKPTGQSHSSGQRSSTGRPAPKRSSPRSLRAAIAQETARLIVEGREHDFTDAKRRAARILGVRFSADDFPSTREIRDALRQIERLSQKTPLTVDALRMSLHALNLMQILRDYPTWLVGPLVDSFSLPVAERPEVSTLATTLWVQHDNLPHLCDFLRKTHPKTVVVDAIEPSPSSDRRGILLVPSDAITKVIISIQPPTGNALTPNELRDRLAVDGPVDAELAGLAPTGDRFEIIEDLLLSLENIQLDRREHPELDALFHALQLFDHVQQCSPFDEELLTAALLHDVAKTHSSDDATVNSQTLLKDLVTHRTLKLIQAMELIGDGPAPTHHQMAALVGPDNLEDIRLLVDLDRLARQPGIQTSSVDQAIAALRTLDAEDWHANPC
jgi:hypothetical protein